VEKQLEFGWMNLFRGGDSDLWVSARQQCGACGCLTDPDAVEFGEIWYHDGARWHTLPHPTGLRVYRLHVESVDATPGANSSVQARLWALTGSDWQSCDAPQGPEYHLDYFDGDTWSTVLTTNPFDADPVTEEELRNSYLELKGLPPLTEECTGTGYQLFLPVDGTAEGRRGGNVFRCEVEDGQWHLVGQRSEPRIIVEDDEGREFESTLASLAWTDDSAFVALYGGISPYYSVLTEVSADGTLSSHFRRDSDSVVEHFYSGVSSYADGIVYWSGNTDVHCSAAGVWSDACPRL
jgi:hypothetical protein